MRARKAVRLLWDSFLDWQRYRCSAWGAALAFYAMVSSAPFLISLYLLAVAIHGREFVLAKILPQIRGRLGPQGAEFIEFLAANFSTEASWTGAMAVFGYLFMAWGALQYFRHLREALKVAWGEPYAQAGFIPAIRQKIVGMVLALLFTQVYLASLWVRVILEIPSNEPETHLRFLLGSGDMLVFFVLQFVVAALVYRFFSPKRARGRHIIVGAAVTATLQTLARLVGGYVLANALLTSLGGLAGGFVALMIWINFMNQVFLYGAEVTRHYMMQTEMEETGIRRERR